MVKSERKKILFGGRDGVKALRLTREAPLDVEGAKGKVKEKKARRTGGHLKKRKEE